MPPVDRRQFVRAASSESQYSVAEQPDPTLAVLLGEFIYTLRHPPWHTLQQTLWSALDEMIVASVARSRRWQTSFPFFVDDMWTQDVSGKRTANNDTHRRSFNTAVPGVLAEASATGGQVWPSQAGLDAQGYAFTIISTLDTADTHRSPVTMDLGLRRTQTRVKVPWKRLGWNPLASHNAFVKGGAEADHCCSVPTLPHLDEGEVHVKVRGAPAVGIRGVYVCGNETASDAGTQGRRLVVMRAMVDMLCALEPFAGYERLHRSAIT